MEIQDKIRAVAAKHFDRKREPDRYAELVADVAALLEVHLDPEPFELTNGKKQFVAIPPDLSTPEFRVAWADWMAMRKRKKLSLAPETQKKQLDLLAECDVGRAVECLRQATAGEYHGLHTERYRRNDGSSARTAGQVQGSLTERVRDGRRGSLA